MERQFFTWDGWDKQDTMSFSFYDVVLIRPIGSFKPGEKFSTAIVDYDRGGLTLEREGKVWEFRLSLQISEMS